MDIFAQSPIYLFDGKCNKAAHEPFNMLIYLQVNLQFTVQFQLHISRLSFHFQHQLEQIPDTAALQQAIVNCDVFSFRHVKIFHFEIESESEILFHCWMMLAQFLHHRFWCLFVGHFFFLLLSFSCPSHDFSSLVRSSVGTTRSCKRVAK